MTSVVSRARRAGWGRALLVLLGAACSGSVETVAPHDHGEGGASGSGNTGGSGSFGSGSTATGNGTGGNGTGGSAGQAGAPEPGDAADGSDAAGDAPDVEVNEAGSADAASEDAGHAGDAAADDAGWVGPVVPPDCPGDPTAGWTEYQDTFHLEYPYDLMPSDRSSFENGIYTFWVFPNDKPHAVGNTTAPRTETHYSVFTTGQHMWTGDVLVESPSNSTTIFQVHTSATGAGPVYLQVHSGNVDEIGGARVATGIYDKWWNLKVAFEAATSTATIFVNNCQKLVLRNSRPGNRDFYFKNGVYTCTSSICRDHYKNVRFFQR
jgi:hypothetical protein